MFCLLLFSANVICQCRYGKLIITVFIYFINYINFYHSAFSLRISHAQGCTRTGYYPGMFATILENPNVFHVSCHFVHSVMSTQKTLFDIFQPSTTKPSQTSSTGQKRNLIQILRRFRDPKNASLIKRLKEFEWLVYVSTENRMKCKTCLDAYGHSAKPSQASVHSTTNFQRSALVCHQWGNDHAMAVQVIEQRKCHEKVMRREEKSSKYSRTNFPKIKLNLLLSFLALALNIDIHTYTHTQT